MDIKKFTKREFLRWRVDDILVNKSPRIELRFETMFWTKYNANGDGFMSAGAFRRAWDHGVRAYSNHAAVMSQYGDLIERNKENNVPGLIMMPNGLLQINEKDFLLDIKVPGGVEYRSFEMPENKQNAATYRMPVLSHGNAVLIGALAYAEAFIQSNPNADAHDVDAELRRIVPELRVRLNTVAKCNKETLRLFEMQRKARQIGC